MSPQIRNSEWKDSSQVFGKTLILKKQLETSTNISWLGGYIIYVKLDKGISILKQVVISIHKWKINFFVHLEEKIISLGSYVTIFFGACAVYLNIYSLVILFFLVAQLWSLDAASKEWFTEEKSFHCCCGYSIWRQGRCCMAGGE